MAGIGFESGHAIEALLDGGVDPVRTYAGITLGTRQDNAAQLSIYKFSGLQSDDSEDVRLRNSGIRVTCLVIVIYLL